MATSTIVNYNKSGYFLRASNVYSTGGITAAGWYRVATIIGYFTTHVQGIIFLAGRYFAYKPSKGVFAFSLDGGSALGNIVQLSGVLSTSPTKMRIVSEDISGATNAYVELYFSSTTALNDLQIGIEAVGATEILFDRPITNIPETPTSGTVKASVNIATISSGHVTTTA